MPGPRTSPAGTPLSMFPFRRALPAGLRMANHIYAVFGSVIPTPATIAMDIHSTSPVLSLVSPWGRLARRTPARQVVGSKGKAKGSGVKQPASDGDVSGK